MKRIKKALRRLAITTAVIIPILLIIHSILLWRAGSQLEKRLLAIRQANEPLTLPELQPPDVSPNENAATFWRRAEDDLQSLDRELAELYDRPSFRSGNLTDEDAAMIRSSLAAYPDAIPWLHQAAVAPEFAASIDYALSPSKFLEELMPVGQRTRSAVRVMQANSLLLLSDGKRDAAMRQCIEMFSVAKLQDRQPMIISYLISLAVRLVAVESANHVLNGGLIADDLRQQLDAELASQDKMDGFTGALRSERAFGTSFYREMHDQHYWMPAYWYFKRSQSGYLDLMAHELSLGSASYYKTQQQQLTNTQIKQFGWTAVQVGPAIEASRKAMSRMRAQLRCLRVKNRMLSRESTVADLNQLGLPPESTIDPFTGQPLLIKEFNGGQIIYSVGENLVDDGGVLRDGWDVGLE